MLFTLLFERRVFAVQGLESKPYDRFVHLLQQFDRLVCVCVHLLDIGLEHCVYICSVPRRCKRTLSSTSR